MTSDREFSFTTEKFSAGNSQVSVDDPAQVSSSTNLEFGTEGQLLPEQSLASEVIDKFEWGGTLSDRYANVGSEFSIQSGNGPSLTGNYLLEYNGSTNKTIIYPADSADYYKPQAGDTFGCAIWTNGDYCRPSFLFGRPDNSTDRFDGLSLNVDADNNYRFGLYGSAETATGGTPKENTWYFPVIDWATDGTVTATIYQWDGSSYVKERTVLSIKEPNITRGKIGFFCNNGTARFDNVQVNPAFLQ